MCGTRLVDSGQQVVDSLRRGARSGMLVMCVSENSEAGAEDVSDD